MQVILKELHLSNFSGSDKLTVEFNEGVTEIHADNGVGKTRLLNAFIWLLFDKNGEDKKQFSIKNTKNIEKNRQDHEVSAVLLIDGNPLTLKKVYKENWQKKHGSKDWEKTGNKTEYEFDGMPIKQTEYKAKVDALVNEELFKLLTNVQHFNKLSWTKQRDIIWGLVPEISNEEVAKGDKDFTDLLALLTNGKTLEEYKKGIASKKKTIKDQLENVPVRIDQENQSIPVEEPDYAEIQATIEAKNIEVETISSNIESKSLSEKTVNDQRIAKQSEINTLKSKIANITHQIKSDHQQADNNIALEKGGCRNKINITEDDIKLKKNAIEVLESSNTKIVAQQEELRTQFVNLNAKEFDKDSLNCPTCEQPFPTDRQSGLLDAFTKSKHSEMELINKNGGSLKDSLNRSNETIDVIKSDIETLEKTLTALKSEFLALSNKTTNTTKVEDLIASNAEIIAFAKEIDLIQAELDKPFEVKKEDNQVLKDQKQALNIEIDGLKKVLFQKEIISAAKLRVDELEKEEKKLAQMVNDFDGIEFNIKNFEMAKIERIEKQVNAKFKHVKFRLFDLLENGEEKPTCEAMVDGVPYADANYAGKINAGLDIINTLSEFYKINAPVFIDNAESINNIIPTPNQIITLSVSTSATLEKV